MEYLLYILNISSFRGLLTLRFSETVLAGFGNANPNVSTTTKTGNQMAHTFFLLMFPRPDDRSDGHLIAMK